MTWQKKSSKQHFDNLEFWDKTGPTSISVLPPVATSKISKIPIIHFPKNRCNTKSLQKKRQQKTKQRKRKAWVIAKALGNETKICAMEPTLKLDGNPHHHCCQVRWFVISRWLLTHKITDSMSEICMDTRAVLVNSRFLPTETNDMLDSWEVVGWERQVDICVVNPCVLSSNTPGSHIFQGTHTRLSSWWLNQPIAKISSSNWTISRQIGVKIQKTKIFEITNLW